MVKKEQYLSPRQVAERLGLQPITIYRWIKSRRIKARKLFNGQLRIGITEIDKILKG